MPEPTSTIRLARAVRQRLAETLPPRVAAAGLPAVREFLLHDPAKPAAAHSPQVWAVVVGARPVPPAGFGAGGRHTRSRQLVVGVSCAGEDAEIAQERLYGYVDLILAVLLEEPTLGGAASELRWTSEEYTPNLAGGVGALLKVGLLTFEALRWSEPGVD